MREFSATGALILWIFHLHQFPCLFGSEDLQFAHQCGKVIEYDSKFKLFFSNIIPRSQNCEITLTARSGRNILVYFIAVSHSRDTCAEITLHDYTKSENTYVGELGRYIVKWNEQKTITVCNKFLPATAYRSISNTLRIALKTQPYTQDHGFAVQVEEDIGSILPQLHFCHNTITFSGSMNVASYPWRKVEGAKRCVTRFRARNKKHISVIFKELYIDGTVAGHCSFNGLLISDGKSLEGPYLGGGYLCGDHIPQDALSKHANITVQLNFDKKTSLYPRRYYLAVIQETDGDGSVTLVPLKTAVGAAAAIVVGCAILFILAYVCYKKKCFRHKEGKEEKNTEMSTSTSDDHVDVISDTTVSKDSGLESHVTASPKRPVRHLSEQPLLEPSAPPVEVSVNDDTFFMLPCGHPDYFAPGFPKPPPYQSTERLDANA